MLKKMKHLFFYLFGGFIVGVFVASIISIFMSYLPYIVTFILLFIPVYGIIRQKKNLSQEYLGVKSWLKSFWNIFKFGRKSVSFYLVMGIVISFLHEEIIVLFIRTAMLCITGIVAFMLLWEAARKLATYKGYQIISFVEAVKKAL